MSEGTLRYCINMKKKGRSFVRSGWSTTLSPDAEEQLAKCIGAIRNLGFSPSESKLKILFKHTSTTMNSKHPSKMVAQGKTDFEHS